MNQPQTEQAEKEKPNNLVDAQMVEQRPDIDFVVTEPDEAFVDYGIVKGRVSPFILTGPRED